MTRALFDVRSAHDVFRDPFGHYHHYTILVGVMESGTLAAGESIALLTRSGARCVSRVLGIDVGYGRAPSQEVDPARSGREVAICTWSPAVPTTLLLAPGRAERCSTAEARALSAAMVSRELFGSIFHPMSVAPELLRAMKKDAAVTHTCPECPSRFFAAYPELVGALATLLDQDDDKRALLLTDPDPRVRAFAERARQAGSAR